MSDLRTRAIVLRRTNFGETDRILSLLTPEGKISVVARGARREKSKLAGGIELFSVADVVIHQGRGRLGTLSSAKMLQFFGQIMTSLPSLELASTCLRRLDRAAEAADNPEYFDLLLQVLTGLDAGLPESIVSTWFNFNYARSLGEEINLMRDATGAPLDPEISYFWDGTEDALRPHKNGSITAREIKLARLLLSTPLRSAMRIEEIDEMLPKLAPMVAKYR